ncbi:hypothetical protein HL670_04459 [Serratia plymuthica]|uniref:contractile injection system protein, VgrG/Pvc8 family n=1 Tax=Serratia plymuthica TaxID=82996 RepID=UPI0003459DF8|nr:contractile injection system protein, VgrG/Pvc8 family [Serratia plymuthica]QJW57544.1 hypothetical protein HL670_04459 [Serratia plymuthica]
MIADVFQPMGAKPAPDFILTLADKDITSDIRNRLISLNMVDNGGLSADQLSISLDDSDGLMALPTRGALLELFLGWENSALVGQGKFIVDTVVHSGAPDMIMITARSIDFRGSLNESRTQSYSNATFGEIVQQISTRNGLREPYLSNELAATRIPHVDQTDETDVQFLSRLALANSARVTVKYQRLQFIRPGYGRSPRGEPNPFKTLTRNDGDSHRFELKDRGSYTGVSASWLNTEQPERASSSVQIERTNRLENARVSQHPAARPSNHATTEQQHTNSYMVGKEKQVYHIAKIFSDKETAMRAAKSLFEQLQRGIATFSITLATGQPDLFPETPVKVFGFKEAIDRQLWVVNKVSHTLSNGGFFSNLELNVYIEGIDIATKET